MFEEKVMIGRLKKYLLFLFLNQNYTNINIIKQVIRV